ncbi:MAG: 3-dehydroquinate synthase [Tissierellia bacterium]|nr:3-dehydroquinate synthase [Tissierellia bacterium]
MMKPMIEIPINVEPAYTIFIRQVLLKDAGQYLDKFYKQIVIITDDNVDPYYSDTLFSSYKLEGNEIYKFILHHGEENKNMNTVQDILNFLSQVKIKKDDLLIALGGGVVGDITGFVASIYLRGMDYIQIPTTFLSAIDSSVGGKTAVNLPEGKNLVGSFKQPLAVFCDTDCFKTLDDLIFSEGVAEALKYALLFDEELFWRFSEGIVKKDSYDIDQIIKQCIEYKKDLVEKDEFDQKERQILNFGHTIGHAIERCSNFKIRHGQGVSIGMAVIVRALERKKIVEEGLSQTIEQTFVKYHLPVSIEYSFDEIKEYLLRDKKIQDGKINIAMIDKIGSSRLQEMELEEFMEFAELGWDPF